MNRTRILLITLAVLLVGTVGYRIWAGWGLITIHANGRPLSDVISEVERKGGVRIQTNMDPARKTTMHVIRAPLPYVLEVLANVSEARWSVGYYLAQNKSDVEQAIAATATGKRPEGWKSWHMDVPRGMLTGVETAPTDPRRDRWEVQAPKDATLQGYLEEGSINVSARFTAPETWNPAVHSAPSSGPLSSVISRLAKTTGSQLGEVVLLIGRRRDTADAGGGDEGEGGGFRRMFSDSGDSGLRRERSADTAETETARRQMMERKMQAEIARLPANLQASVRQEQEERKAFFDSLKDLTPEERRSKFEDRMNNPANAEKMANGKAARDAMKSPDQREDKYRSYIANKQAATSPQQTAK